MNRILCFVCLYQPTSVGKKEIKKRGRRIKTNIRRLSSDKHMDKRQGDQNRNIRPEKKKKRKKKERRKTDFRSLLFW